MRMYEYLYRLNFIFICTSARSLCSGGSRSGAAHWARSLIGSNRLDSTRIDRNRH